MWRVMWQACSVRPYRRRGVVGLVHAVEVDLHLVGRQRGVHRHRHVHPRVGADCTTAGLAVRRAGAVRVIEAYTRPQFDSS